MSSIGRRVLGICAGLLAGLSNVVALPYPAWFRILGPVVLAAGSLAGRWLGDLGIARRRNAVTSHR